MKKSKYKKNLKTKNNTKNQMKDASSLMHFGLVLKKLDREKKGKKKKRKWKLKKNECNNRIVYFHYFILEF